MVGCRNLRLTKLPLDVGPQVGGLYRLMVVLLPKYVLFRYPAKLFVIAALAMCVLAGFSVKRIHRIGESRRCWYFISIVLVTSSLMLASWPENCVAGFFGSVPPDVLLGPSTHFRLRVQCLFQFFTWQSFVLYLNRFRVF